MATTSSGATGAPGASPVSVNYTTANVTAGGNGSDYTGVSGTLNFATGETLKVVRVFLADDVSVEALETFRWHRHATVDKETYQALNQQHRLIADVVCFPGCHINHLTPRTLDIDRVQSLMAEYGIEPKAVIEGPPRRAVPLLLRQHCSPPDMSASAVCSPRASCPRPACAPAQAWRSPR